MKKLKPLKFTSFPSEILCESEVSTFIPKKSVYLYKIIGIIDK